MALDPVFAIEVRAGSVWRLEHLPFSSTCPGGRCPRRFCELRQKSPFLVTLSTHPKMGLIQHDGLPPDVSEEVAGETGPELGPRWATLEELLSFDWEMSEETFTGLVDLHARPVESASYAALEMPEALSGHLERLGGWSGSLIEQIGGFRGMLDEMTVIAGADQTSVRAIWWME